MQGAWFTKWAGRLLAAYLGLALALIPFGILFTLGQTLMSLLIMAVPVLLWDLFVRQPHRGRFARARAERRAARALPPDDEPDETQQ
jgi:hypothetical protein